MVPLGEINIPILQILPLFEDETSATDANAACQSVKNGLICIHLYAHYGSIKFEEFRSDIKIIYDTKKSVTLISSNIAEINGAFEHMSYKSTEYEPKGATDVITIRYGPHKAQIPVEIKFEKQPVLIDPKDGNLEDFVTICIKTFERYPCLNRLIDSIREYHPAIRIVIADDSIEFKEIEGENIDHFKMPPGIGFNNGKNLAISQVCYLILFGLENLIFCGSTVTA